MENIKYQKIHVDSIRITNIMKYQSQFIFQIHKHFKLLLYNKLLIFFQNIIFNKN